MKPMQTTLAKLLVLICALSATSILADDVSKSVIKKFTKIAESKWGTDNVTLPSSCVWVEYEPDLGERFAVCFKSGTVMIQILLRESDDAESEVVMNHIRQGVKNTVLTSGRDTFKRFQTEYSPNFNKKTGTTYTVKKGDNLWVISKRLRIRQGEIAALNRLNKDAVLQIGQLLQLPSKAPHLIEETKPSSYGDHAILANQLKLKNGTLVTKKNIDKFTKEIVDGKHFTVRKITGNDGVIRQELTIEFKLITDHLQLRAQVYRPAVKLYANKFGLDEAVLLALIHTESSFNPRARSKAPAYGLMQIVPRTAGLDATKFLFGKEKYLSSSYLYNPSQNIQTGTAYMHILDTKYWGDIKDPISRQYCVIAAYNGGSGNVSRALTGTKSRRNAIEKINTMTSDAVYRKLLNNHRLSETRKYLEKITERTPLYASK